METPGDNVRCQQSMTGAMINKSMFLMLPCLGVGVVANLSGIEGWEYVTMASMS